MQYVGRGKVEVTARLATARPDQSIEIDAERLAAVSAAVDTVRSSVIDCRAPDALRLLTFPGVQRDVEPDTEALQSAALASLDSALADLRDMRASEGARLAEMLTTRAAAIREHAAAVRKRVPEVRAEQAEKLRARLAEMDVDADPARVETELVMAAQRMDVAEELDRLRSPYRSIEPGPDPRRTDRAAAGFPDAGVQPRSEHAGLEVGRRRGHGGTPWR